MKKRDVSIDFWRGMAIISVILIHTVFHSGERYVPISIACISLLFDIPVFMFISGMVYAIKGDFASKIKEIVHLLYRWTIFVVILFIYLYIVDKENVFFKDFFSWISFRPSANSIYSIGLKYSLWFMIYYIQSVLLCSLVIDFFKHKKFSLKYYGYFLILLFFMLISTNNGVSYFSLSSNLLGYAFFFILGYIAYNNNFLDKLWKYGVSIFTLLIIILGLFKFNGFSISDLQTLKGNMSYIYVLVSLFSLFTVLFLKNKFKYKSFFAKVISFVGKNSICMYFAQGISSSLLYLIEPNINLPLCYKLFTMFVINLSISSTIFVLLYFIFKLFDFFYNKILEKK